MKFFSLLKKDDRREQMVYYQVRGAAAPPITAIDRTDLALLGLHALPRTAADGYRHLHDPTGFYRRRPRHFQDARRNGCVEPRRARYEYVLSRLFTSLDRN